MKIFSAEIINKQSAKHKHAQAESELNISNTIPYDSDRRTPQRWACPVVSAPVFHVGFLSDRRGILPRNWSLPDLSPAQLEKGIPHVFACRSNGFKRVWSKLWGFPNQPVHNITKFPYWYPRCNDSPWAKRALILSSSHTKNTLIDTQGWWGLAVACEP